MCGVAYVAIREMSTFGNTRLWKLNFNLDFTTIILPVCSQLGDKSNCDLVEPLASGEDVYCAIRAFVASSIVVLHD